MIFVQASSTPSTINARSFSENGKSVRNLRTKLRINARLAVWLLNWRLPFFIAQSNAERASAFNQVGMKPNWTRLRQGYGVASSFDYGNSRRKAMDSFEKRLFSLAHVENIDRVADLRRAGSGAGTVHRLRRSSRSGRAHQPRRSESRSFHDRHPWHATTADVANYD